MSVPKNNLAELLRRKAKSTLNSAPQNPPSPVPASDTKRPKFKPAISTSPTISVIRKTTNGLPSFSTPGFKQTGPPQHAPALEPANDVEVIYVSDASNPTTPNPLKRTSSDPDAMSDLSFQTSKRHRKSEKASNKENILPNDSESGIKAHSLTFLSRITGKAVPLSTPASMREDTCPIPTWMDSHSDLFELSSRDLDCLRNKDHELLKHIMDLLLDGADSKNLVDTKLLQKFRRELNERLEGIKWVEEAQKQGGQGGTRLIPPPPAFPNQSSNANQPSPSALVLSNPSTTSWTPSLGSVTRNVALQASPVGEETEAMVIDVDSNPNTCVRDYTQIPQSDDEYWDSVGEISETVADTLDGAPTHQPTERRNFWSPYHDEIQRKLKDAFGLTRFRPNQLEAITATMDGRDVFVLMPTGGGKSLCYQLPAVCETGKTSGVTVVVSPLTALMQDQVSALTSKGIDAFFWSADSPQHEVSSRLWGDDKKPSLLYLTPEKLRASNSCRNLLSTLYRQKQLARFAIDEAHCISTWGQDFRSAYQGLGQLREEYPDVPIIALTATANQRAREDIINQLRLRNHLSFTQSFNRPNLKYIIKTKKNVMNDIVDFIKKERLEQSGVIYCTSRKSCEQVAEHLQKNSIAAEFFHAGLSKEDKNRLLEHWKADKFRIIVATIAFGMGIDKADVRFVIHHDVPNSLSGYYQETGRAGRDGKPAICMLYYRFRDFKSICRMIESDRDREEPLTPEAIQRQKDAAREVVKYCANISECRRVQILRHFGQDFNKLDCQNGCDNCLNEQELVVEDVTAVARSAINILQAISETNVTLQQLAGILRGSNSAENRSRGLDQVEGFGVAKNMSKELVELALDRLLVLDVLTVTMRRQRSGYFTEYVEPGSAAISFKRKEEPMYIEWRPPPSKRIGKPVKQIRGRQPKDKQRAANLDDDDPIEPFPDEDSFFEQDGSTSHTAQTCLVPSSMECSMTSIKELYQKLDKLRYQIMDRDGLPNKAAVVNEAFLHELCYSCPRDYLEFHRIVDEADGELPPPEKYHDELLQVCIQHQLGATRNIAPPSTSQLHSRFRYHDGIHEIV